MHKSILKILYEIIPANIYLFKVISETLEKGIKYVQS